MRLKLLALLIALVLLGGCRRPPEMDLIDPPPADPPDICGADFPKKLDAALNEYSFGFEEDEEAADEDFLDGARACEREEIIPQLTEIVQSPNSTIETKAKAAYILIKLGHEKPQNGNKLIDLYFALKKENLKKIGTDAMPTTFDFKILSFLDDAIENDEPSLIGEAFRLQEEVDGAYAEFYSGIIGGYFEKNPEDMLRRLKEQPKALRQKIIRHIFYSAPKDQRLESLKKIAPESDLYSIRQEMEQFAKENCKEC